MRESRRARRVRDVAVVLAQHLLDVETFELREHLLPGARERQATREDTRHHVGLAAGRR